MDALPSPARARPRPLPCAAVAGDHLRDGDVLVVGCGLLHELDDAPRRAARHRVRHRRARGRRGRLALGDARASPRARWSRRRRRSTPPPAQARQVRRDLREGGRRARARVAGVAGRRAPGARAGRPAVAVDPELRRARELPALEATARSSWWRGAAASPAAASIRRGSPGARSPPGCAVSGSRAWCSSTPRCDPARMHSRRVRARYHPTTSDNRRDRICRTIRTEGRNAFASGYKVRRLDVVRPAGHRAARVVAKAGASTRRPGPTPRRRAPRPSQRTSSVAA